MLTGLRSVAVAEGWVLHAADIYIRAGIRDWNPHGLAVLLDQHVPADLLMGRAAVRLGSDGGSLPAVLADEEAAGRVAAEHLLARGFRRFGGFGYWENAWAVRRAGAFRAAVKARGGTYAAFQHRSVAFDTDRPKPVRGPHQPLIEHWLDALPKPVGILAACDRWGGILLGTCRRLGLRVPEDVAVVGVDNDQAACDLAYPPLSSVALPWERIGQEAGWRLVEQLEGAAPEPSDLRLAPVGTVTRQSSDTFAIDDPEVTQTLAVIAAHADRPLSVADILRQVPATQHTLERKFRRLLGRRMLDEVRRVHVDRARRLLATTELPMSEVASRSGFAGASKLSLDVNRETGVTPTAYRRRYRLRSDL